MLFLMTFWWLFWMKFKIKHFFKTALHSAVENDEADVVQLLLDFEGIDVNIKDGILILIIVIMLVFDNLWFFIFFWKLPVELTENEEIKKLFNSQK